MQKRLVAFGETLDVWLACQKHWIYLDTIFSGDDIRRQLLGIYPHVKADQVFATGTPQFDFHFRREFHWTREEFCERIGADPHRPIVLYTTGMPNHM